MTINQFLESLHLEIRPTRTEWQGQNDYIVVLKLWFEELDWASGCISCLDPVRPTGQKGGKWDRRQEALDEIRSGSKDGFFTIGSPSGGKQLEYASFRDDGVYRVREITTADDGRQWVHFDKKLVSLAEVRNLALYGRI